MTSKHEKLARIWKPTSLPSSHLPCAVPFLHDSSSVAGLCPFSHESERVRESVLFMDFCLNAAIFLGQATSGIDGFPSVRTIVFRY